MDDIFGSDDEPAVAPAAQQPVRRRVRRRVERPTVGEFALFIIVVRSPIHTRAILWNQSGFWFHVYMFLNICFGFANLTQCISVLLCCVCG